MPQRVVDHKPFRRGRQQGIIGRYKQGRQEPALLHEAPHRQGADYMDGVVGPQRMADRKNKRPFGAAPAGVPPSTAR